MVFALYSLTLSESHSTAEDALGYVIEVNLGFGPNLFHPNHLLFNLICWAVWETSKFLGYSGDAGPIIQIINALAGSLTVTVLFFTARRIFDDVALSATIAAALAVSYAFWFYSVETDTYILPLFFVLLAFRVFLETYHDNALGGVAAIAALLAIATLIHQQYVFSFGAFAVAYVLLTDGTLGRRLGKPAILLALGGCATLSVYTVIGHFIFSLNGFWEIIGWARGYAAKGLWEYPSLATPLHASIGLGRAIFGLDILFAFDWFYALIDRAFPTKLLVEERFTVAGLSGTAIAIATVSIAVAILTAACMATSALAQAMAIRHISTADEQSSNSLSNASLKLSVPYTIILAVFTSLWEPLNIEFWIAILPFVFLMGGHMISAFPRGHQRQLAMLFVSALGVANLVGSIVPQTDRSNDYWYMSSAALFAQLRPGDLLLTEGGYIGNKYAVYFAGPQVKVVPTRAALADELVDLIEKHPSRVLISSWVFAPPEAVLRSRQFAGWNKSDVAKLRKKYGSRLTPLIQLQEQTIWVLDCHRHAGTKCESRN